MVTEPDNKPEWLSIFQHTVDELKNGEFNFKSLTTGKAEIALTSLIAHGIMSINQELSAYIEVPSTSRSRKDLIVFHEQNRDWENPKIYAEFKYYYDFDIESLGSSNEKHIKEYLGDLIKLYEFKLTHKQTTCLQGFYFCHNENTDYRKSSKNKDHVINFVHYYRELIIQLPEILKLFQRLLMRTKNSSGKKKLKQIREELLKNRNLLKSIHSLPNETMHILPIVRNNKGLWLSLVLFEVIPFSEK